ncbi:hypothetical protein [Sphingomonas kyeonggiensis]|uniref:Uncharacterized protein n=1 Tax=Sphingomonas kyeonggiensis TaxID=1268553 RepID=A0A7W6NZK4_9SPHN|nr:hypothetical protein [Sphingomonas kyeonggiensis]MBB4100749.1 hypothetical protein [Sphingomonas kyeonggiensis]
MIVLIATAWGAEAGGINAFNFGLARALAAARPGAIACAILDKQRRARSCPRSSMTWPMRLQASLIFEPQCRDRPMDSCALLAGNHSHSEVPAIRHDLRSRALVEFQVVTPGGSHRMRSLSPGDQIDARNRSETSGL